MKGGIGFFGALTLIFVVLKVTALIAWPWFSFNPFEVSVFIVPLVGFYLAAIGIALMGLIALGWLIFSDKKDGKSARFGWRNFGVTFKKKKEGKV